MSINRWLKAAWGFYRPRFNRQVVSLLQSSGYRLDKFVRDFWRSDLGSLIVQPDARRRGARNEVLRTFLDIGGLCQLALGIILIVTGALGMISGGVLFGLAAVISYPIIWAHFLVIPAALFRLPGLPKELGRQIVLSVLGAQVKKLRSAHDFKVVAVAGSVGKTSTKTAIAQVLSAKYKVRWQGGNYNDPVTVPLVIFGESEPSLYNPLAWLRLFRRNREQIKDFDYEVVVLELGSDCPGTMAQFGKYLHVDIGVVTAVAPEHMEFFGSLDNVAREELGLANFSRKLFVNSDLVADFHLKSARNCKTFAIDRSADYRLDNVVFRSKQYSFDATRSGHKLFESSSKFLSRNQLYSVLAAGAAADELGMPSQVVADSVKSLKPAVGRLNPLKGIKNSTILDDSYNSAPEAAIAALETLYNMKAPHKIAVLGNMNELGSYSEEAHKLVGEACDPKQLDLVVAIGHEAGRWLASAARAAGCKIKTYDDPYAAGAYLRSKVKTKSLILVKGSQNGVFSEETVKLLLKNKSDADQLVRQSPSWLRLKEKAFNV